jgi:Domain of unknown function (DUF4281)
VNPLDSVDTIFDAAGALAASGWLALMLSPARARWTAPARRYAGRVIPLLLAGAYVALVMRHWGPGGFGSLAEVRALFDVPGLLLAGWLHYLAFDLFVGAWIAERAAEAAWPHALLIPVLLLTFLFGPAGLLAFALLRVALRRPAHAATRPPRS